MIRAKKFRVTFERVPEYSAVYQLELHESGAFRYGNQTCVAVLKDGKHIETIDTRYVVGIKENFAKWCEEYTEIFNNDLGPSIEWLTVEGAHDDTGL